MLGMQQSSNNHNRGPFERHFLPVLFEMTGDTVFNVRGGVARVPLRVLTKYKEHMRAEPHTKVAAALFL